MNMGVKPEKLRELAAEFPREEVHWRAQSVSERDGKFRALALAYIDARNVMERLDAVCGPENWSDRMEETPQKRVLCGLSININGEWVMKWDGAGETDVEGDKGALSDALKRAAVKWGIGRYLYSLPNVWVPCEVNQNKKFKKFIEDPWKYVPHPALISDDQRDIITTLSQAANVPLIKVCEGFGIADLRQLTSDKFASACKRLNATIKANSVREAA
jgi:hypothetical protein